METVSVTYEGGIADLGRLRFYEFGRAAYGYARFVSTIEKFRQTGRVPDKIVDTNKLELYIEAPQAGSFVVDVLVGVAVQAITLPLPVIMEYILNQIHRIRPGEAEAVLRMAEAVNKESEARVRMSEEETKRLEIIRDMLRDRDVNPASAIATIDQAHENNSPALEELQGRIEALERRQAYLVMKQREENLQRYEADFSEVDPEKLIRLASKVRSQLPEIALPLRNSAATLKFSYGDDRSESAVINRDDARDIASRVFDEEVYEERVRIALYDKDFGRGKVDLLERDLRRVPFGLARGYIAELQPLVLAAMDQEEILARIQFIKDRSGLITSVIINEIPMPRH